MKVGETILEEQPYCHVLSQKRKESFCDSCFLRCRSLKRCTGCIYNFYCDRTCQKRDWAIHKLECKCLKRISPKIPLDSVRLLLRLIIAQKRKLPMNNPWSRNFDELMTHAREIIVDQSRAVKIAQIVQTVRDYASDIVTLPIPEILFPIICKMVINSFTISDSELQEMGTGVYLSGSMLDHSCSPNALATFQGNTIIVKATVEIPDPSPNKIFISYVEQMATTEERQQMLREQYYFQCVCDICKDTERDDLMTAFVCPNKNKNCSGPVCYRDEVWKPCRKCGFDEFTDVYKTRALELLERTQIKLHIIKATQQSGEFETLYQRCKTLLHDTGDVLHHLNVYQVRLLDMATDGAIQTQRWEDACNFAGRNMDAYRLFYPVNSPNLAIQLLRLGKLQLYLQKLQDAYISMTQAEAIYTVTHGEENDVYEDVMMFVNQCEHELQRSTNPDNSDDSDEASNSD